MPSWPSRAILWTCCTNPTMHQSHSHNAAFCKRNVHMYVHFRYKKAHCWIFVGCIVRFVRWLSCLKQLIQPALNFMLSNGRSIKPYMFLPSKDLSRASLFPRSPPCCFVTKLSIAMWCEHKTALEEISTTSSLNTIYKHTWYPSVSMTLERSIIWKHLPKCWPFYVGNPPVAGAFN